MSNINDYLKWRGDIPLDNEFYFNEIDSMILARFSYLLFDRINMNEKETIESIYFKMKNYTDKEFRYHGDKELIENLGNSNRFRHMIVTDYVKNNDKDAEKQFSAITIHINEKEMYISFIGTDNSLYGWKEDFNMAFMRNVPAQLEGIKYLQSVANKYPNKLIRLGGHSKGGNVAVYSAILSNQLIQDRIIKVCNYDGPGFDKSITEDYKNQDILSRVNTYIPQDSIIGRILEHEEKFKVVQSIEKGIHQHDIYSWQVMKDDIIKLESVTNNSNFINETLKEWLKKTTPEQRKIFINSVFELFYATSSEKFSEISTNLLKNITSVIKTYKNLSEEDRRIMTQMLMEFGRAYYNTVKHNEKVKLETFEIKKLNSAK